MGIGLFKNRKEKEVVVEIGAGALRGLVLEKGAGAEQKSVVGFYEQECEPWESLKQGSLKVDVLKQNLLAVFKKMGWSRLKKLKKQRIIISLPKQVLKSAVVTVSLEREDEEAKITKQEEAKIREALRHRAGQLLFEVIKKELGLEPHDFQIIRHHILEIKMSGYKVMSLFGIRGKQMEFKAQLIFALGTALNAFSKLIKTFGLENYALHHSSEGLVSLVKQGKLEGSKMLVDLGGGLTTVYIFNQVLEVIGEFKIGSRHFIQALKQNCKLTASETESLLELLVKDKLSPGVKAKVEKALLPSFSLWQSSFAQCLKRKKKGLAFAPNEVCFFDTSDLIKDLQAGIIKSQAADSVYNGLRFNNLALKQIPVKIKQGLCLPKTVLSMILITFV